MYRPGQSGEMDTLATHGSSTDKRPLPRKTSPCSGSPDLQESLLLSQCLGSFPHPNTLRCFSFFPIDAHSLWYNFTIIRPPRPEQRWCEVHGQVDQKNFLSYDCGSDKVLSVGRLEEQLNATDAWGRQLEMLREAGQRLRLELPGIELEDFTPSGPARLQARMSCECEADGHSKASWEFRCDGQKFLLFDSNSRKWTVVHAGARRMKEKWEEDRELTDLFWKVSVGDCRSWLRDFLICREKRLEPTAPPTVARGIAQSKTTATTLSPPSCFLILLCLILHCICGESFRVTGGR
uniref:MHC class I-like antigen recognition-like domain-containing protein n=1 Tax=Callithrix jacchus TaxID=9483 RepID=A0A5F4VZC3_CALJA